MSLVKDFYTCSAENDAENSIYATIRKQGFSDNLSAYKNTLQKAKISSLDYKICQQATFYFLNSVFEKCLPIHMEQVLEVAQHYTSLLRNKIDNYSDIAHLPSEEIQEIDNAALSMQLIVGNFDDLTYSREDTLPLHLTSQRFNPLNN